MQLWELEGAIIKEVGSTKAMTIMAAVQQYLNSQNSGKPLVSCWRNCSEGSTELPQQGQWVTIHYNDGSEIDAVWDGVDWSADIVPIKWKPFGCACS